MSKQLSPEELQASVTELTQLLDAKEKEIEDLLGAAATDKKQIKNLNKIIGASKNEPKAEVEVKNEIPVVPSENIEVDGKEYKWAFPTFILPGSDMKQFAASATDDVIAMLLSIEGQSILVEQA